MLSAEVRAALPLIGLGARLRVTLALPAAVLEASGTFWLRLRRLASDFAYTVEKWAEEPIEQ